MVSRDIFRINLADKVFQLTEQEYKVFYKICLKLGVDYTINLLTPDTNYCPFKEEKEHKTAFRICNTLTYLECGDVNWYINKECKIYHFNDFKNLVNDSKQGIKNKDIGKSFEMMLKNSHQDNKTGYETEEEKDTIDVRSMKI